MELETLEKKIKIPNFTVFRNIPRRRAQKITDLNREIIEFLLRSKVPVDKIQELTCSKINRLNIYKIKRKLDLTDNSKNSIPVKID